MVGRSMSLKNPVTPPGIDPGTVRLRYPRPPTIDIAVKNYRQIQTFYQNYISSVKYTRLIDCPLH